MALVIDSRLLEPDGECEPIEDFNRTLAIIDDLLPEITVADQGKVLGVDDTGKWATASVVPLVDTTTAAAGTYTTQAVVTETEGVKSVAYSWVAVETDATE